MVLLKHKPILLYHFDKNKLYDIQDPKFTNNIPMYSSNHKIGDQSYENDFSSHYLSCGQIVSSLNFLDEYCISVWLYCDYSRRYDIIDSRTGQKRDANVLAIGPYNTLGYWVNFIVNNENSYISYADNRISKYYIAYDNKCTKFPTKTWHHYEIDRNSGGTIYTFIDGKKYGEANVQFTFDKNVYSTNLSTWINCNLVQYMDELLCTQHCLHTSDFTPYTEPYYWNDKYKLFQQNKEVYSKSPDSDESIRI